MQNTCKTLRNFAAFIEICHEVAVRGLPKIVRELWQYGMNPIRPLHTHTHTHTHTRHGFCRTRLLNSQAWNRTRRVEDTSGYA